jgi:hypothetical protein
MIVVATETPRGERPHAVGAHVVEGRGDRDLLHAFQAEAVPVETFISFRSARTALSWALSPPLDRCP